MPRIPLTWLAEHVALPAGTGAQQVATDLSRVGLEEEAIFGAQVTGPLVVGRVLELVKEPQKNGKTINWVRVDVGPEHNEDLDNPKDPQPGEERPSRGIICGAHNFVEGDLVVVSLPGTVLPGDFAIAARKTYGHTSDGMICSGDELGLGPDPDGEDGIIVLGRGHAKGLTGEPGDDAIALLGLADEVVEINVTPDRGYCFAMRGVAREYAHATGAAFTDPALTVEVPSLAPGGVAVERRDDAPIRGEQGCTRFVALEVTGVDPSAQTPRWMARRLTLAGMRPISLIVDVTNYVMLDLGQPLHAYDAALVQAPIVVRRARAGETLTTLDDVQRTLDPEDLLISDGEDGSRVLGLAGVMGGADTEVSASTADIVLEAATFDPVTVARTARRHRLPSEASKRFERGVDPELPLIAATRAAQLIVEHGGGTIASVVTDDGAVAPAAPIRIAVDAAERLVGIPYTAEQVRGSLEQIGCDVEPDGEDHLVVTPPSWRPDLLLAEDLVEEIARLVGYTEIPSVLPTAPGGRGLTVAQRARRSAQRALAEAGLVEVKVSPFVPVDVHDTLRYAADDERRRGGCGARGAPAGERPAAPGPRCCRACSPRRGATWAAARSPSRSSSGAPCSAPPAGAPHRCPPRRRAPARRSSRRSPRRCRSRPPFSAPCWAGPPARTPGREPPRRGAGPMRSTSPAGPPPRWVRSSRCASGRSPRCTRAAVPSCASSPPRATPSSWVSRVSCTPR